MAFKIKRFKPWAHRQPHLDLSAKWPAEAWARYIDRSVYSLMRDETITDAFRDDILTAKGVFDGHRAH